MGFRYEELCEYFANRSDSDADSDADTDGNQEKTDRPKLAIGNV